VNNRQRKTDDFRRAKAAIRLTRTALPDAAVHLLAEEEVTRLVTRLQPRTGQLELPQPADISMFCDALLSADIDAGAAIIRQARREGMDTETVYLGYIAGAAQHLGKLWEDDRVSFMNVSVAASRIFGIMRLLRYEIANARKLSPLTQHAMFACVPRARIIPLVSPWPPICSARVTGGWNCAPAWIMTGWCRRRDSGHFR